MARRPWVITSAALAPAVLFATVTAILSPLSEAAISSSLGFATPCWPSSSSSLGPEAGVLVSSNECLPSGAPSNRRRTRRRNKKARSRFVLGMSSTAASETETGVPPPPPVRTVRAALSSGTVAEVMTCVPSPPSPRTPQFGSDAPIHKPPLAFVHGSFHASWCWSVHFMPHFASLGYPCAALSLRGTGGTPHPAGEGVTKVKIEEHVRDVRAFLDYICDEEGLGMGNGGESKPVLVAHSFGGLSAMKLLEEDPSESREGEGASGSEGANRISTSSSPWSDHLSGVALLCSVPPSGISRMSLRSLRRTPLRALRSVAGLAMKKASTNPRLCREMFFAGDKTTEEDLVGYMEKFQRDSVTTIDLGDLSKKLPSKSTDAEGKAVFADGLPPVLVLGGTRDFIVDKEGLEETATFFGSDPTWTDAPHDVMLCTEWREGADAMQRWLEKEAAPKH